MDYLYEDLVSRYSKNFIHVIVPKAKIEKIKRFVGEIIEAKRKEDIYALDYTSVEKRFITGLMGEAALEELLGIDIIEWTVGDSMKYSHPDICKLGVGVKTVERNKFPIIFKKNRYPQIICVKSDKREDVIFVCGLATVEVLNRFQSDTLVIRQELVDRGSKTGFYGFCKLKRIECIDDIKNCGHGEKDRL